ncbi:hypothetical protein CEXT_681571 [Caerostris extrusa]|uniref:Uncharacterized protein n=1 Tax=Caerostris extrusa TaxID=172846 RepID=A0AAV4NIQ3_CAEEX|nr:hypothetical protein CEXT_681571 [Caerostris extrusa]
MSGFLRAYAAVLPRLPKAVVAFFRSVRRKSDISGDHHHLHSRLISRIQSTRNRLCCYGKSIAESRERFSGSRIPFHHRQIILESDRLRVMISGSRLTVVAGKKDFQPIFFRLDEDWGNLRFQSEIIRR